MGDNAQTILHACKIISICIFLPRFLSFINDASSNDQSMYVSIIYTRKIHRFDVKRSCVERRGTRVRPAPRPGNDSR